MSEWTWADLVEDFALEHDMSRREAKWHLRRLRANGWMPQGDWPKDGPEDNDG